VPIFSILTLAFPLLGSQSPMIRSPSKEEKEVKVKNKRAVASTFLNVIMV
jgi:hypothetical protein